MGISYVPPVFGGTAGALGGRSRSCEEAEAVDGTGGVPACRRTRRRRPRHWIQGIAPWLGAQRLRPDRDPRQDAGGSLPEGVCRRESWAGRVACREPMI